MHPELHGQIGSCWTATAPKTSYPHFDASCAVDVGIVGGGIVGLSTAYLLASAGLSVVVLDNERFGETGEQVSHTSAGIDIAGIAAASGFAATETVSEMSRSD